jgi:hypothetical protein
MLHVYECNLKNELLYLTIVLTCHDHLHYLSVQIVGNCHVRKETQSIENGQGSEHDEGSRGAFIFIMPMHAMNHHHSKQ